MSKRSTSLSVMDISEICGVARSTVSYWISKKSLAAYRSGKRHLVALDDLVLFLKAQGQPVPQILLDQVGGVYPQPFRPFKRCWEYWARDLHGTRCKRCSVFTHCIEDCFTGKNNQNRQCPIDCHECHYFGEYFGAPMAFIHQFHKPAAIYKDLYLWSGNKAWAELCGVEVEQLIGAGIEDFVHADSLKTIISYDKRRIQGDTAVPDRYQVAFRHKSGGKIGLYLAVSPLIRPAGTWLAVAEKTG